MDGLRENNPGKKKLMEERINYLIIKEAFDDARDLLEEIKEDGIVPFERIIDWFDKHGDIR